MGAPRAFERAMHPPCLALSHAFRADILAICQGDMNDTTLVWGHCLECDRATIVAYLLCHSQCKRAQVLLATLAVVFRVHNDAHAMLGSVAYDQADEEL